MARDRTATLPAPNQCRWPLWPTGTRSTQQFCCAPALPRDSGHGFQPYCAAHRRLPLSHFDPHRTAEEGAHAA
jgi:hypothetical protein